MTATKSSRTGIALAVVLLGGSLALNIYLWRRASHAGAAPAVSVARSGEKPKPATRLQGIPSLDFARDADLPALRDALYAAGASETRARQIIYGVLRRRYREAVTQKRLASISRGWWKDETRTLGITRASQSLRDENVLLKQLVDDQIEAVFGLDPTQVAVVNARYSYMPEELRTKLAKLERAMQLPAQWVPTGDPEVDAKMEAEWAALLKDSQDEKNKLLATLTPEQRREYDMRYGQLGTRLASEYRSVPGGTEEEFRKLYRIAEEVGAATMPQTAVTLAVSGTSSVRVALPAVAPAASPVTTAEINQRIVDQVVAELGYDRAMEYLYANSAEYRGVAMLAQQGGVPASTAMRFTQLATDTGAQANAIHKDASLNADQRRAALVTLQQTIRAQVDALVPAEAQQKLPASSLAWLNQLSAGQYRVIMPGVPGRNSTATLGFNIASSTSSIPPTAVVRAPVRASSN